MSSSNTIREESETAEKTIHFRSQMGSISRHSAVFFAGTMFTTAAGYLFKVYVARKLGAEALGVYALGMTIIGLVAVFNGLGLQQSAVRFVALYTADGKSGELRSFMVHAIGLLTLATLASAGLILLTGPWIAQHVYHTPSLASYFPLFALLMIVSGFSVFFGQVLQGYRDISRRTIIRNFIGTPLMMLLSIALISAGTGLRGYIIAQVISGAVALILLVAAAWRLTPAAAKLLSGPLSKIESQVYFFGAAVFGVALLEFLLGQIDKVLIGVYINAREVGIYAVAMAIVTFVPVALKSVNQIFSPTIADLHTRGEHDLLARLFQTLTKWVLGLTLPLAMVVMVFSKPLMQTFGHDFEAGWIILVIGTLGQLINCGVGSVGYMLLMSGNEKRLVKIQTVMAVVVVTLNVILIPRWGIVGAAVAAAITNACSNVWYLRDVKNALRMSPYTRGYVRLLPPALATFGMAVLLKFGFRSITPAWLGIVFALILCYATLVGVSAVMKLDSDDQVIANAIWARLHGSVSKAMEHVR